VPGNTNPFLMTFSDLKADSTQSLSWQTFTLSAPLQHGLRLTQLPPPSVLRAGIFAPRCRVKQCQSSSVPKSKTNATGSCLLYAGRPLEQLPPVVPAGGTAVVPFWARCLSHFTDDGTYDASNTGFSRQHGSQG
jgi:hypothetical protein